jgi:hypothetical protein
MDTFFIKPAINPETQQTYVVMDPDNTGATLSAEGEEKPKNTYWLRRLADGGVIEVARKEAKTK